MKGIVYYRNFIKELWEDMLDENKQPQKFYRIVCGGL